MNVPMSVPSNRRWAEALRLVLKRVYDPTTRVPVPWYLSGNAALNLQGVSVEPDIIEFRAISPFAAAYFAQLMRPYEAPDTAATIVYRLGGNMAPSESWRSNVHQRIVAWSSGGRATWLGRWPVAGATVQVSYVRNVHPDPTGLALKASTRRVRFENLDVAAIPLEYSLAEAALRSQLEMTQRILHSMRTMGHNPADLRRALALVPQEKASRLERSLEFNVIS
jgi:hypothetical protein